jgi:hypothetical protein
MVLAKAFRSWILGLATLAQIGIGAAIVYFVAKLQDVKYTLDNGLEEVSCALDSKSNVPGRAEDNSLCFLAFAGVGITFALMFALSVVLVRFRHTSLCVTRQCGCMASTAIAGYRHCARHM